VYTSLVLPSHQHVPITNGRYKLQTLEGFSLKSSEINDFAPLRVTLKHRAVIFGPTSWRCEPVCTCCAYVNHFWPSLLAFRSGHWLELGTCKRRELGQLVAPLQRFQWPCDLFYMCVRWHVEKRRSLFYISHLVHCAFLSVSSRVDKLEDQIIHLFDQNLTQWHMPRPSEKFLDNSMQPQSKVVCKAHKRGRYRNEESSWGRGDSEFQILVMPHMRSL